MHGHILRFSDIDFQNIPPRPIDIWLPPGYDKHGRYPVIYMHDGQNLFYETEASFGITWGIDDALHKLIQSGKVKPAIVVGIWNIAERRWAEYCPQRPFDKLSTTAQTRNLASFHQHHPYSDHYLKFIVNHLKPRIDEQFATDPDQTFMMGSSMGGLISLYALCEYPQLFKGVACLSTHWIAIEGAVIPYFAERLPTHGSHRIYFDYGTETLDVHYEPYQMEIDKIMSDKGFTQGKNWITRKYPGAAHNESAWSNRVHIPLEFLLKE